MLTSFPLDLVKEYKTESYNAERECYAVIRCGRTQSQKSREVAYEYEYEQCRNISEELCRALSHTSRYHVIEHLDDKLNYILKRTRLGIRIRFYYHVMCTNGKYCEKQDDYQ